MTEIIVPKSLTEQILDEMFADIEKYQEYDGAIVENLRQLAQKGDLKKAPQIAQAVKAIQRSGS